MGTARIDIIINEDSEEFLSELAEWLKNYVSEYSIDQGSLFKKEVEELLDTEFDKQYIVVVDKV